MSHERARAALEALGLDHHITSHERAGSLAQAAAERGVSECDLVKTLVIRRSKGDYVFVLVPGGREISWPKLRKTLGANRLSMPSAEVAFTATGYQRGTITPFGATTPWPVVADESLAGSAGRRISLGAGEHGKAVTVLATDALKALDALVADVTVPAPPPEK
ncbi:YbaK/EbsC family protein [Ornithinimicrobium sp. Arc0846-15]|nr:YbaK/EbsC family protein [Ornithinimicrobium laminariae]